MESTTQMESQTIEALQNLIKINIDSAKGFQHAADQIEDPKLKTLFQSLAQQRSHFADQLRGYVRMNDHEAEDSGSLKGQFHRWWLQLRKTISLDDRYAILAEAERGEDVIKERYEALLQETAGSPVNDVLLKQYGQIKQGHDTVRDLRDAAKKT